MTATNVCPPATNVWFARESVKIDLSPTIRKKYYSVRIASNPASIHPCSIPSLVYQEACGYTFIGEGSCVCRRTMAIRFYATLTRLID